jgi:hypothetical protein
MKIVSGNFLQPVAMPVTPPESSRGSSQGPKVPRSMLRAYDLSTRRAPGTQRATVSADRWVPGTRPGMTVLGGMHRAPQGATL